MTLKQSTLRKLSEEEIIKRTLEYQFKFDSTLTTINHIKTNLPELRKNYENLEPDLMVTEQANTKLCDQMKF